jgi:tRNA (guanine37-N1)-methyltransferase
VTGLPVSLGFHFITVFPEMIEQAMSYGVVSQAMKSGLLTLSAVSPRIFTSNVHQTIDDRPFGGGDGMIMLAEPLSLALEHVKSKIAGERRKRVIHLSPRGRRFSDELARDLATSYDDLILIASRYGGVDQRFLNEHVDEEISIGDYVLSGGELAGLVLIDTVARLVPGVLGNDQSANTESFGPELKGLEFPQFTRPREWQGISVPEALMSGDHARISKWKKTLSILVTAQLRPELLGSLPKKELELALKELKAATVPELQLCGLCEFEGEKASLEKTLTEMLNQLKSLK